MTDEEKHRNQRRAELEAKSRAFGGAPVSDERIEEVRKSLYGDNPFSKKYPGSNGCEMAILTPDGAIEITDSNTANGSRTHGSQLYPPDHKDFNFYWKRHDFDNQKSATHVIMKRFDNESKEWIELGEEWIGPQL